MSAADDTLEARLELLNKLIDESHRPVPPIPGPTPQVRKEELAEIIRLIATALKQGSKS